MANVAIAQGLRHRQAGFTLIELLVVLTIAGLLLAAAPVVLSAGRPSAEVKSAAFELADTLRAARMRAAIGEQETRVAINVAEGSYVLMPGGTVRRLPRRMGLRFQGPQGEVNGEEAVIRFFPDGSSTGGEVTLSEHGRDRHVRVHWLTGRIAVNAPY